MKNFQRLAFNLDVGPILHALQLQPDLWNENPLRQTFEGSPHAAVDDIWLRFGEPRDTIKEVGDDLEAVSFPAWHRLPQVRPLIYDLMRRVEAERLGRAIITRLAPGGRIDPHADVLGAYASYYSRYHIVLQGLPGAIFQSGDEAVQMRSGEVWWFNAAPVHAVFNNSADDRIHLLVDLKVSRC